MCPSMYVWDVCKRVITFWLVYFIVRIQCITHITYKICVNRLFMLSIRLPVSSRLLVVKFLESQTFYMDFRLFQGSTLLKPSLLMGQLYIQKKCVPMSRFER